MFWSKQNPRNSEEVERHSPYVVVRGAVNGKHLFGAFYFDGSVNHFNYITMLENWFTSQLQSLGIESNAWFQEDGEPAHFAITAREYLNEVFPSRWIGCGSATLPAPLDWLPRSPDRTPCGDSL